jgi:pimeloyl-ACP methyl ester carboxylesterase
VSEPGPKLAGIEGADLNRYTPRPMPDVEGVRHRIIRVRDVDLHLAEAGDGPPLLLLHGYPQHWYLWRRQIPDLAQDNHVLIPDLRGFGWSQAPREGYDKETLMWDVLALLDELGIEKVPVAGHDWGGWIGMLIGVLAPERLERVLIMSVSHLWFTLKLRTLAVWWRVWHGMSLSPPRLGVRAATADTFTNRRVARWLGGDAWTQEEWDTFMDQFREPERAWAAHRLYYLNGTTDFPKVMRGRYRDPGLEAPGLILLGNRDRAYLPWWDKEWQPYAPNSRLERVPGANHALVDDAPEVVLGKIREFLLAGRG